MLKRLLMLLLFSPSLAFGDAAIVGTWTLAYDVEPTGDATVGAGTDRKLVWIIRNEAVALRTISTFTIGGQTASEVFTPYNQTVDTTENHRIYAYVWDETKIAAMTGTTVSYTDDQAMTTPHDGFCSAYVTVQGVDQTAFGDWDDIVHEFNGADDDVDVDTVSTAADYVAVLSMTSTTARDYTSWDTLTEIEDTNVPASVRCGFGAGAGGDAITSVLGDGTAEALGRTFVSLVFPEVAAAATGAVKRRRR